LDTLDRALAERGQELAELRQGSSGEDREQILLEVRSLVDTTAILFSRPPAPQVAQESEAKTEDMNRQLAELRDQMANRLRKFVQGQATVLAAKEAEVAQLEQQAAKEAEAAQLKENELRRAGQAEQAAQEEAARQAKAAEEEAARQAKTPSWMTEDKEEPLLVKSSWRKAGARSWRKSPAPVALGTTKPPASLAPLAPAPAPAPVAADDFGDFGSPSSSQVTHHNGRALHRRTREVAKPKARAAVSGGALLAPSSRKTKLKPAGPKLKPEPVVPSPAKSDCSDLDFLEDFNF
jgi:hypothetical protein